MITLSILTLPTFILSALNLSLHVSGSGLTTDGRQHIGGQTGHLSFRFFLFLWFLVYELDDLQFIGEGRRREQSLVVWSDPGVGVVGSGQGDGVLTQRKWLLGRGRRGAWREDEVLLLHVGRVLLVLSLRRRRGQGRLLLLGRRVYLFRLAIEKDQQCQLLHRDPFLYFIPEHLCNAIGNIRRVQFSHLNQTILDDCIGGCLLLSTME